MYTGNTENRHWKFSRHHLNVIFHPNDPHVHIPRSFPPNSFKQFLCVAFIVAFCSVIPTMLAA
jgi:hypothetical protein